MQKLSNEKYDIFFGISTIEREENKGASKEGEEAYQD